MSDFERDLELHIPPHMHDGLRRYVEDHIKPGGFLYALLCGDIEYAMAKADSINTGYISTYALFFIKHLDPESFGTQARVDLWLDT